MPNTVLAFDIGGTKTAWAVVDETGKILKQDRFPTPGTQEELLGGLLTVAKAHPDVVAVGVGFPGPVTGDGTVIHCTQLPHLAGSTPAAAVGELLGVPSRADNDARCALIGEIWKGAGQDITSAVFLGLGTGIGGAVMQKGRVLPAPHDVMQEIGHIVADPSNPFPGTAGPGTIESLIGGKSTEERFGVKLSELSEQAHKGNEEALELWKTISYYFLLSVRAIADIYSCKRIIVGGGGAKDLEFYLQDPPPCSVVAAELGTEAGLVGAARLAWDAFEEVASAKKAEEEWD